MADEGRRGVAKREDVGSGGVGVSDGWDRESPLIDACSRERRRCADGESP